MPSSGLARTAAAPSYGEDNSVPFMYFTNHTVLFRKSLADIFDEDNLVWDLPDQVEALDFYDHDIFALLHDNSIWRLSGLEQGQGHVAAHHLALKGDLGQVELEELAVDWLEEELILVVKTEDQGFAFATCGLGKCSSALADLATLNIVDKNNFKLFYGTGFCFSQTGQSLNLHYLDWFDTQNH